MRQALALALLLPGVADAAPLVVQAAVEIQLQARDLGDSLQIEGSLQDDRGEPLTGRTVSLAVSGVRPRLRREVVTDASGQFRAELPGHRGASSVLATTAADALYHAGERRVRFERTDPPKPSSLSLEAEVVPGALDDTVILRGRLTVGGLGRTARLKMTPGGAVDTDASGRFEAALGGWRFPGRRADVAVAYAGASDARRVAARVSVDLPDPAPTPGWVYLGPLAVTLLLLLGAWLREWRRRPKPARPARAAAAPAPVLSADHAPPVPYALADQDGVAGVLVDRTSGAPLAGGRVALLPGNRVALTDRHGRFRFDQVPPGEYSLRGEAKGHMPGEAPARFPHRGELAAVRLALTPVREAIRDVWRQAATRRDGLDPWPSRTPEEVARGVMGDFAALTALLEEAWWSPRPAEPGAVSEAEGLAGEGAPP